MFFRDEVVHKVDVLCRNHTSSETIPADWVGLSLNTYMIDQILPLILLSHEELRGKTFMRLPSKHLGNNGNVESMRHFWGTSLYRFP